MIAVQPVCLVLAHFSLIYPAVFLSSGCPQDSGPFSAFSS